MRSFDRREFISLLSSSVAGFASTPLVPLNQPIKSQAADSQPSGSPSSPAGPCWLDVCAPFIVEDDERGIHTEIILTSDTFVGSRGYEGDAYGTDYEIYLYDAAGKAMGLEGVVRKLTVLAMRTTVINARELIGGVKSFWGGMKIRLQPRGPEPMHASDLFSSAFVRWQTESSFDNVHANPDPLQWQRAEGFYYSMPFPALAEYICTLALFNPYGGRSAGNISLFDRDGGKAITKRYDLKGYSSLLLCLNNGSFADEPSEVFGKAVAKKAKKLEAQVLSRGGLLAVTNDSQTMKSFAYLLIRQPNRPRFSVEHPIHQNVFTPRPETPPFDSSGNFKAKNVLYSPLVFNAKKVGAISLESRCLLGTGLPIERVQWFYPFVTDADGAIQWDAKKDPKLSELLPISQYRQGVIRLPAEQSCELDFTRLALKGNFSGGISLAVNPDTTHTLMKVEVRVPEWGAHAFTHFRPGLQAARAYQKPKQRGGIVTDYITSGARLERRGNELLLDELIAVINIDDQGIEGQPILELFGSSGWLTRIALGSVPGFACRHYLLSDLTPRHGKYGPLTLRLVDEHAALLMSILHIDHVRRDIALDHGSDRFSTLLDYNCSPTV
jgi:hypothetical protein